MPRDIFGNLIKTDVFGRKISKKEIKREVLEENRRKGKAAEEEYKMGAILRGVEPKRTGKGHDFIEIERDPWSGKEVKRTYKEIKSSRTAPLSDLQKKTKKKKGGRFKVERIEPLFY